MQKEVVAITDTPRTDALAGVPTPDGDFANFHIQKYKEHARSLERENNLLRLAIRKNAIRPGFCDMLEPWAATVLESPNAALTWASRNGEASG